MIKKNQIKQNRIKQDYKIQYIIHPNTATATRARFRACFQSTAHGLINVYPEAWENLPFILEKCLNIKMCITIISY